MATIREVAEKAGASVSTVSRVLNNEGYASPATRQKVERAAAELGYRPNVHARRLRGVESRTIALLSPHVAHPFSSEVSAAIDEIAQLNGYCVIVGNTNRDSLRFRQYLNTLVASGIDGLIVAPPSDAPDVVEALKSIKLPLCQLDQPLANLQSDQVITDNALAAYKVARWLLDAGCRRIAFLGGTRSQKKTIDRLAGYEKALREVGIEPAAELAFFGEYDERSGFELTQSALSSGMPDALFATNLDLQVGMLNALRHFAHATHSNLRLGAIDELPYAKDYSPIDFVAGQPTRTIGVIAAQLLIDKIEGRRTLTENELIVVKPTSREGHGLPATELAQTETNNGDPDAETCTGYAADRK